MELPTAPIVKHAIKLGGLIVPLLVIGGLMMLWVLIVIVCLYLGQVHWLLPGSAALLH